uniref:Cyclin E2 n=1 Tax=Denticeps clupeoides TaxID=299321 RepID=A0AAY4B7M7_9TELE
MSRRRYEPLPDRFLFFNNNIICRVLKQSSIYCFCFWSDKSTLISFPFSMFSERVTLQVRDENAPDVNVRMARKRKPEVGLLTPSQHEIHVVTSNRWPEGEVSACALIETPHKEQVEMTDVSCFKRYRVIYNLIYRQYVPISWASSDDVWIKMLNKELKYVHDKSFMERHPNLQPKMRSILLDWLLEVSEVYTLHRETFYLAQDYFDRFMLTQEDVSKNRLQLIGITSLFIASKMEEIYPPKLQEFAYVTDGACDEDEILEMELILLKLLDLCILDIESLDYHYGVLAAAAFWHFSSFDVVHKVSGLTWDSIESCVRWMTPFVRTVSECSQVQLKDFKKVAAEDSHNIQTHVDYLTMLNDAHLRQHEPLVPQSPVGVGGILTPPKSTEKPLNQ